MTQLSPDLRNLALNFFEAGAFQDKSNSPDGKGFKLKLHDTDSTAPLSPVYFNLRHHSCPKGGPLTDDIVRQCGRLLYMYAADKHLQFDCVVGLPHAGDPIAQAFKEAAAGPLPVLTMKKEEKGASRRIVSLSSGDYKSGDRVLVLDDLITGAHTKLEATKVLLANDLQVTDILVLVDRQQGGAEQLAEQSLKLHALFPLDNLLDCYVDLRKIEPETKDEIMEYIQAAKA